MRAMRVVEVVGVAAKTLKSTHSAESVPSPLKKKQSQSQNAYMLIEAWERVSANLGFTPALICRKASSAKSQSFMRCLAVHSLSATGILLGLMHLSTRARGEGKEEKKERPKRLLCNCASRQILFSTWSSV
eukprot:6008707-Amphidinium_carterae.1